MNILVEDLKAVALVQTFTMTSKSIVSAVRPYCYLALNPAGSIKMTFKDSDSNVVATVTQSIADIVTNSDATGINFFQGFIRFQFADSFLLNSGDTYTLEMEGVGYTFGADSFGWIKEYENRTNDFIDTGDFTDSPLSFQLWSFEK